MLAINAKYVHSSLAVWVLSASVKKYAKIPHDVKIVEATINQSNEDILSLVLKHNPTVVAISTYIWNAKKLPEIIDSLQKMLPEVCIIMGGPEASFNANYWLANGADHVLEGEGEYSLPLILDNISCPEDDCAEALDKLPEIQSPVDPYTDEYFETLAGRLAYIETSRGCPFTCAFCLSAGSNVRFFPIEPVKTKLKKLSLSGTHTIKLVDRTFNCNAKRAYELFEYIIGLKTTCCFHFEVAADLFDEQTLLLLSSATSGRIQLEAGLQSFFEPALNATTRKTSLEKAEQNIHTLMKNGNIHLHVDLIAGLPYENLQEFKNSFHRAFALKAHTLQLGFLKLLHGSALRKQANSLGIVYSDVPPYEIKHSPWLSVDDLQILKHVENALQHTYNKARFLSVLDYVLTVSAFEPFELFYSIGRTIPNHGVDLADYASSLFDYFTTLPNVDEKRLSDYMVYDWLSMVKGKNMPEKLKNADSRRSQVAEIAEKKLGRKLRRDEVYVLSSGEGIFADSESRDPVTGLYAVEISR